MTERVQLAYEEKGMGRPVVLLHGFCGSTRYWDRVVPLLSDSFRVITVDLRGHGRSEVPDSPYTIEAMADDVAGLLTSLQLDQPPVLLGHSLGGYVTLAVAENVAASLGAYGLIHSTAYPDAEQAKANRDKTIAAIRDQGMVPFIDGLIPKLFAPAHVESMGDHVQAAKVIGYATAPQGAMHTAAAMRDRPDRNHVLLQENLPVLLVAGEQDQLIPVGKTFSVQGVHLTPVRIPEAGHMSMYEAPEALADAIKTFVEQLA
ncbi:alpha/beta fold hydrolase [Paenibacillus koleovorans]|uniref:alpha/beta fold hydrolase n=1 Tax=Paenibacillus koleovorans TaxID=121608 RepID=UPI000FD6F9E1|nr:alpha/beta hydrolase [Paenibacillus koleovorans]